MFDQMSYGAAVSYVQAMGIACVVLLLSVPFGAVAAIHRGKRNRPGTQPVFPRVVLWGWAALLALAGWSFFNLPWYGESGPAPQTAAGQFTMTGSPSTNHPLQCRCGTLKGHVTRHGMANRALCYCKDCQAFANFLGHADTVLDGHAGTPIVAVLPSQVHFSQGLEALACMSLSDGGLLRWYAGCCNTPLGNTPRNFKMPYVGLIESCLASDSPSLEESFGPVRMVLNTSSARGRVKSWGIGTTLVTMVRLMKSVIGARLGGGWRRNPFFDTATGTPVVQPRVLTRDERKRVTDAA